MGDSRATNTCARLVLGLALPAGRLGGEVAGGRQKPVVRKSVRWGEWTGESCSDSSICGGEALLL